jgi:hypothetical protein
VRWAVAVRIGATVQGDAVGLLDNVERGLERFVSGAFAKSFRGGVQPIEVIASLKREMDSRAVVVQRDRILAPHAYTVGLNADDLEPLAAHGSVLIDELTDAVRAYATRQRYSFTSPVSISLVAASDIARGVIKVASQALDAVSEWHPALEINGETVHLSGPEIIIGRGSTATVILSDSGASRHHARILWSGKIGGLEDLQSTNGTILNGTRITSSPLDQGDVIQIGGTKLIFRILPGVSA